MTIERFKEFCDAQPFRPFVIQLADGREVPVAHPAFIATAPSGRTVGVYQPDDTFNMIDLLLVTDLEIQPNGKSRRKHRK